MGVALFDLDRTLLDCNSGRLWVQEEWRRGTIGLRDVLWAGWWLGRYSLGWDDGLDGVMDSAVVHYAGQPEAQMDARVREWFARDVAHHLRPGARQALDRHRAAGDRLVLATSSSPYAGGAACRTYGLDDLICTRFEVVDGHFTGRVAAPALGEHKLHRAREWADREGVELQSCAFYTDSFSDLALLEAVAEPIVVNPDRALRKEANTRKWPIVDWGRAS